MKAENKQQLYLFFILIFVVVGVSAILIYQAYDEHLHDHQREMIHIVKSRARIIEAVAKFDSKYSSNYPGGHREATLSQIREAHENFEGFGETGEFVLGELKGDTIHFLLRHRHENVAQSETPPKTIAMDSPIATPMQKALKEKSGLIIGVDYRGKEVLAAFEPVKELNLGLVAKIDFEEIRGPFIEHGIVAVTGGFIIIIIGTIAFFKLSGPLIRAIRESDERLKTISDNTSSIIYLKDVDGRYTFANKQFEKIWKLSAKDIIGKTDHDLFPRVFADDFVANDKLVIESKQSHEFDEVVNLEDGKHIYLAVKFPLLNKNNEPYALCGISQDITERKNKEIEITKLSRAVEQSPAAVIITDRDGIIEYVNPKFTDSTGYPYEEAIGKNPSILKSGETPKAKYKKLWDTILAGKEWKGVFHNRKKDGTLYWENASIAPLKNKNGEITHFIAVKEDITERKKMETTLLDHETFIDSIVANMHDGLISINRENNIQLFNATAEKIFGWTSQEIMGKDLTLLTPEVYREKHKVGFQNLIETGQSKILNDTVEIEGLRKNGTSFPLELSVSKMTQGDETWYVAVVRDISDKKENEERLRIAQKQLMASQKLASIGELSAGVSHEVLNPVNIISVHSQMLKRKVKDDERVQLYCDKVSNEIKRIQKIMGGLLDFSRQGDTKLEKGTLREHIEKVIVLVENEYILDNVTFERDWCDKLVDIEYDADKLRQVFLNLINNAKQAMPNGGTITIGCRPVKKRNKSYHQFSFKDTGSGMNEEVASKIFNPFFTTKAEGQGTGMGLSIVHGIIEEHGGEIEIETQEGKGTTFFINLPLA